MNRKIWKKGSRGVGVLKNLNKLKKIFYKDKGYDTKSGAYPKRGVVSLSQKKIFINLLRFFEKKNSCVQWWII